ncbi:MAG: DUF86 domain-containing protein [Microcystis sp. M085S1]|jgi:uncharacterized protein with HEPN domain|nr:DUF86 domain-containing protein [Microcystis sp. M085S1]
MHDRSMLLELFLEIQEGIRRIERRFSGIDTAYDFIRNDDGLDRLDAIAMMLVAIGENTQKLDKFIAPKLFEQYPDIDWSGIKGLRNILAHNYFSIDAEEIYRLCSNEIEPFKNAIERLRNDSF